MNVCSSQSLASLTMYLRSAAYALLQRHASKQPTLPRTLGFQWQQDVNIQQLPERH